MPRTPTLSDITPGHILNGTVYVDVFCMMSGCGIKDDTLCPEGKSADFYDVMVRHEDWEATDHLPYAEWEDLTSDQLDARLNQLETLFPGISVNFIEGAPA
jgi:hypothetical protein